MVSKVLRTLPMRYNPKVSTLEERDYLKKIIMDELNGILTAYEIRIGQNGTSRKEAAFKASIKNQLENPNDEEAVFINELERGTGKYKGKLPLKCFNCGRIGHFSSKRTYTKQYENGDKETSKFKMGKPGNKKKSYGKKKLFTPWKIVKIQMEAKLNKLKFYLWV